MIITPGVKAFFGVVFVLIGIIQLLVVASNPTFDFHSMAGLIGGVSSLALGIYFFRRRNDGKEV